MLEAGEDIKFSARRIMICASEDVGNADPQAVMVAAAAALVVERVGLPEAQIPLAHAATYVACAPKSNASYMALVKASQTAANTKTTVPPHLQDAHYGGAAKLGRGIGYQYAHDFPGHYVDQQYLPSEIMGSVFYEPSGNGYEKVISEYLERIGKRKKDE